MAAELLHKDLAYRIIGACMEVYNVKGPGFAEPVYQECVELELGFRNIPFVAQPRLQLEYEGCPLTHPYVPDIAVDEKVILELKAVKLLLDEHRAQVLNYLKATDYRLALLVNFGRHPELEWERLVL
jgi:GxxExxY protein